MNRLFRNHSNPDYGQKGDTAKIVIFTLAFLSATLAGLSGWALYRYDEERTTVEDQISEAVSQAKQQQRLEDEERFEEERKSPYETYSIPDVFGSVEMEYPKTWSVYVEDTTSSKVQVDMYMHPDLVRIQDRTVRPYALRMQLIDELYQQTVDGYQNEIEDGEIDSKTATVSDIEGVRLSGQISRDVSGEMIILPYRDKTIQIWTEGDNFIEDFDKILDRTKISR